MMNYEAKDFQNKSIRRYLEDKAKNRDNDFSQLQEFLSSLISLYEGTGKDGIPLT